MRKIILYTAVSIDGFIAKEDGSIDWLPSGENKNGEDNGYQSFYENIDTVLIGRKTYEQILSFPCEYPYVHKKNYVFSRTKQQANEFVEFINENIDEFVMQLKNEPGKSIWLVGGGELNRTILELGLIDEIILTIIPVVLGKGIHVFGQKSIERNLKYVDTKIISNEFVQVRYILETKAA